MSKNKNIKKEGTVITFPKSKKDCPPQTLEEIQNNVQKVRLEHINIVTDEIATDIMNILMENNVDITENKYMRLNAFMVELCKAFLCKSLDINHVFHEYADKHFEFIDETNYEYRFDNEDD